MNTQFLAKALAAEFCTDNWGGVYRALYKGTACGVGIGIKLRDIQEYVYCEDLYKWPLTTPLYEISVSSIVEGVDECTDTHVIELDKFTRSRDVIRAIYRACDEVEMEAEDIWKRTHGCLTCAKHWDSDTPEDPSELTEDTMNWGDTPVWSDCPDCGGDGIVI